MYADHNKSRDLDYVWDIGHVYGELVTYNDANLISQEDLFASKIVLGLATLATVAVVIGAIGIYSATTAGKPTLALFQGISLVSVPTPIYRILYTLLFCSKLTDFKKFRWHLKEYCKT